MWKKIISDLVLALALVPALFFPHSLSAQVVINGTITDESKRPIESAKVKIEPQHPGSAMEAYSDKNGAFNLNLDAAGQFFVSASSHGFYELKRKPVDLIIGVNIITIDLIPVQSSSFSIDVYPEKNLVVEYIALSQTLTEEKIDSIPATRSNNLQNLMATLPGALRDQRGNLHFYGSPSDQINWLLDGFNVADPASGQLEAGLGVEAVKSFDLFSGRYSVEFGKGSGGTMIINSGMGDNRLKYRVTNFIPGIDNDKGLRLTSWRPRFTFSGPVRKDKVWFFNGLDFNYRQNIIAELPRGQDRTLNWVVNNLFHLQANLTPANILTAGFLFNYLNAPKSGLSPLTPVETTLDKRARRYFFNIKDQIFLPSKTIIEFGFGSYRSINREVPLGHALYQITPLGRRGNFSTDALLLGSRDQWLTNAFLPAFNHMGSHQFKVGLDFNYSRYFQDIKRNGLEAFRVSGTRGNSVFFEGNGKFSESNLESAAYFQDRWAIKSWLVAEAGIRWDRDAILSKSALTPRFSFALMPPALRSTKLSAGFGLIPPTTNLRLFTRHLDQYSVTTYFGQDGEEVVGGPLLTIFSINKNLIKIPKTRNFSLGLEQRLPWNFYARANYLRKRGYKGYTFSPTLKLDSMLDPVRLPTEEIGLVYALSNSKIEIYDSFEISLNNQFFKKYDWFLSYARSRAYSNAALDVNIEDPIIFSEVAGRLPWDTPNRLISWGLLPVTQNNSLAYFLEWRDGFLFSVHDEEGRQVGKINSWKLPRHFNLNLHFERKIALLRNHWALRFGFDNITNRPNYSLVNNNISSPAFLEFFGRQPRKFVVRIRWLGKVHK